MRLEGAAGMTRARGCRCGLHYHQYARRWTHRANLLGHGLHQSAFAIFHPSPVRTRWRHSWYGSERTSPDAMSCVTRARTEPARLAYAVVEGADASRLFEASHSSETSATARHPLSIVSEWPRPSNSWYSVVEASLSAYMLSTSRVTALGTVWSSVPETSRSGPRTAVWVSTVAGELRLKFAVASSNRGR